MHIHSLKTRIAAVAVLVAGSALPVALLPSVARADTITPSFSMTDGFGTVWNLRPAGSTGRTHNYAGTADTNYCGSFSATATRTIDPQAGTWDWTFIATPTSSTFAGCVAFTYVGTGIGNLSGTWSDAYGDSGDWNSGTSKGAGTLPGS